MSTPADPEPALFEVLPEQLNRPRPPELYRGPDGLDDDNPFAVITYCYDDHLGLFEFHLHNVEGSEVIAEGYQPGTVRIIVSPYGETEEHGYTASIGLACSRNGKPDDTRIKELIVEAEARYRRRWAAKLDPDDADGEDGLMTFHSDPKWPNAVERKQALDAVDSFTHLRHHLNVLMGNIALGRMRPDHAAHLLMTGATNLLHRHT